MERTRIEPGQTLGSQSCSPPVVRVICRYPFDKPTAAPRWVVEHINQPGRVLEIVDEEQLKPRDLMVTWPLLAPLSGASADDCETPEKIVNRFNISVDDRQRLRVYGVVVDENVDELLGQYAVIVTEADDERRTRGMLR